MRVIGTKWMVISVLAVSLALAGCGQKPDEGESEAPSKEPKQNQTESPEKGAPGAEEDNGSQSEEKEGGESKQPETDSGTQPAPEEDTEGEDESGTQEEASAEEKSATSKEADNIDGAALYQSRCTTCHGPKGKGEGALAQSLKPKPRDHTNPDWQDSVTDKEIAKTIKKGGPATGLSATMPPHPDLSDPEVQALVDYIRSLRSGESGN